MSSVLWFQGGACSGNTMSFLNAEEPNVVDLIVDFGLDLIWHPSLGMELGDNAKKIFADCASGARPMDIFVMEGTVIQGPDGSGRMGDRTRRRRLHRGGDRRLRVLGRYPGDGTEPERLHRPAVPQA
jgi:Ni,Fe-hydrogenase I small subunit